MFGFIYLIWISVSIVPASAPPTVSSLNININIIFARSRIKNISTFPADQTYRIPLTSTMSWPPSGREAGGTGASNQAELKDLLHFAEYSTSILLLTRSGRSAVTNPICLQTGKLSSRLRDVFPSSNTFDRLFTHLNGGTR